MFRYLAPLLVFCILVTLFVVGLENDPQLVPSPLIGKPVPAFELPVLQTPDILLTQEDIKGEVVLINVWASWCVACRHEHPLLVDLSKSDTVKIIGLNYKDSREAALGWLEKFGDPYFSSLYDSSGRTGIDLGVYGVPETYLLDRNGIIRYKHIGPVDGKVLEETLLPLINQLKKPVI